MPATIKINFERETDTQEAGRCGIVGKRKRKEIGSEHSVTKTLPHPDVEPARHGLADSSLPYPCNCAAALHAVAEEGNSAGSMDTGDFHQLLACGQVPGDDTAGGIGRQNMSKLWLIVHTCHWRGMCGDGGTPRVLPRHFRHSELIARARNERLRWFVPKHGINLYLALR